MLLRVCLPAVPVTDGLVTRAKVRQSECIAIPTRPTAQGRGAGQIASLGGSSRARFERARTAIPPPAGNPRQPAPPGARSSDGMLRATPQGAPLIVRPA